MKKFHAKKPSVYDRAPRVANDPSRQMAPNDPLAFDNIRENSATGKGLIGTLDPRQNSTLSGNLLIRYEWDLSLICCSKFYWFE